MASASCLAMMNPRHTSLCASAAIAAALALVSTPGLAQVADTRSPSPVAAAPAPAPVSEAAPPAVPAEVAAAPQVVPAEAAPPEVAAEPVETVSAPDWSGVLLPAILGGLAVLALAIWGFVAIGRRKPADRRAALVIERPVVARRDPEPVAASEPPREWPRPTAPVPAPSLAHSGAAVPLPGKVPESFEERDALIKRMVAAKPDRANPFTTYHARLKRARLILQSLGREFGGTEPRIDLSQYSANWPELSHRKHAAA